MANIDYQPRNKAEYLNARSAMQSLFTSALDTSPSKVAERIDYVGQLVIVVFVNVIVATTLALMIKQVWDKP